MERCAEGECILLCKETPNNDGGTGFGGINKLVVIDNNLVWELSSPSDAYSPSPPLLG